MDDILRDFVVETTENIEVVDAELVRFEREPSNGAVLAQIFRLVHTVKGTCGFLGLPRLEALAHAAEAVIGRFREGAPVTREAVSLILASLDRIKLIVAELERAGLEPEGADDDLIAALDHAAEAAGAAPAVPRPVFERTPFADEAPAPVIAAAPPVSSVPAFQRAVGTLVPQALERALREDEAPLDELERAFRDAPGLEQAAAHASPAQASPAPAPQAALADAHGRATVRVGVEAVEHLMTMVSELVLTRNQLLEIARRDQDGPFKAPLARLSLVTAELQEGVMKTRLQPVAGAFARLPRLVRDLSEELGKPLDLVLKGEDTEVDRQVLELVRDPLTHMIRNAADHGIESPAERARAGKGPRGRIEVSAGHEGGHVVLTVTDDGRGLDANQVRAKAVALGLATEEGAARLSDAQAARFIFHPGFSTAAAVTAVSGRGVGMDVVRANVEAVGGAVDLRNLPGRGTSVVIRIPLTLAIAAALVVEAGGQRFALPQAAVVELVRAGGAALPAAVPLPSALGGAGGVDAAPAEQRKGEARVERLHGVPVLRLRDELLPLAPLAGLLGLQGPEPRFVAVCQMGGRRFGLGVEAVLHTEEIVVKPLSSRLRGLGFFAGTTILGDGAVILILDPAAAAEAMGVSGEEELRPDAAADEAPALARTSLLVVRVGAGFATVPLAMVERLEEVDPASVESTGEGVAVQYRGRLMPLRAAPGAAPLGADGPARPVLVFARAGRCHGLVVDEIVDIVEEVLEVDARGAGEGAIGTAILRGRATSVLDVGGLLPGLAGEPAVEAAPRELLLLDGEEFFRALLAPVLGAGGWRVRPARDLAEARALAASRPFDAAVLDLDLGPDAFALAADLGLARGVPLVGTATRAGAGLLARAREAGLSDVVGKFDRQGLLAALEEAAPADAAIPPAIPPAARAA